jgi:hypothetical protein
MRTFLRHMATGHYFRSPEKWTLDRDDAFDFGVASKALKAAQRLHMRDLELVLSVDNPAQVAATPFEKLLRGLTHSRRHALPGKRPSRQAALA